MVHGNRTIESACEEQGVGVFLPGLTKLLEKVGSVLIPAPPEPALDLSLCPSRLLAQFLN